MELSVRGRQIRTTAEHPFYVNGKGWICAREITIGDEVSSHDGQSITVEAVTDLKAVATVYNLRVSDYHTYFVGCQEWGFNVWAHNADYVIIRTPDGLYQLAHNTPGFPAVAANIQGGSITEVVAAARANGVRNIELVVRIRPNVPLSALGGHSIPGYPNAARPGWLGPWTPPAGHNGPVRHGLWVNPDGTPGVPNNSLWVSTRQSVINVVAEDR